MCFFIVRVLLFNNVNQGYGSLGQAKVVLTAAAQPFAAVRAVVFIVVGMYPPAAYLKAQIPAVAKHKLITVSQAGTVHSAFVTAAFGRRENAQIQIAHIELAAQRMQCEEMTVEGLAGLRLHQPVLHLLVVLKREGIVVSRQVDGPAGRNSEFCAQIQGRRSVVKQVRLYGYLLCRYCYTKQKH